MFSCHISCDALRCAGAGDQSPHSDGVSTVYRNLRELPSVPDGGHGWTRAIHGTPRAQMDYIVRARRTAYGCVHQGPLYGARRMQRKTVLAPRDVSRWGRAPLAGHRQAPIALTVCCRATTITHNTRPCSVTAVGSKGAVGRRMGGEQIMRRAGSREKKHTCSASASPPGASIIRGVGVGAWPRPTTWQAICDRKLDRPSRSARPRRPPLCSSRSSCASQLRSRRCRSVPPIARSSGVHPATLPSPSSACWSHQPQPASHRLPVCCDLSGPRRPRVAKGNCIRPIRVAACIPPPAC